MDRRSSHGHVVLPIFYHVDPSNFRKFGGSFNASFDDHESNRPSDDVKRWKAAFAEAGKLKGWHIGGGKSDRSETDYIKDIVNYVTRKLMNVYSERASEEFVGIDDQKETILNLVKQKDSRVIGLWGMGGIGKTTLVDVVYKEVSLEFEDGYFLQNVSEKIEKQGRESLRNELLSELLNEKEIRIDTPSIGYLYKERLNNKKVIVVLDDVTDSGQIEFMGVRHFGTGSKIIVTSRDRQVLKNGGADKIHEVKKLNEEDSFQLFSTFAFKMLNPAVDFRDLSSKFVEYAQGSPLALKVLGSKLYTKSRKEWESEVDRLKQYVEPKISQILKSSIDGLDELEKNIFLDIACFFKGELKEDVEEILSCLYKGAVCGISNLLDKCLLHMLEEMGKDIVCRESKEPRKRSRLWDLEDKGQVLKNNKGTVLIEGIKLDMSQMNSLQLRPSVFENMLNLKHIYFYVPLHLWGCWNQKSLTNGVDGIVSLPSELRYLRWDYYPFRFLSPSFHLKNLVQLKLRHGSMELLWNKDTYLDLVNLKVIDISYSIHLRKIPNLLGAINLKNLVCYGCESLVKLSSLNHLTSLENLQLPGCNNLREISSLSGAISLNVLNCEGCESLVELPCLDQLSSLEFFHLSGCKNLRKAPNLLGSVNLKFLDFSWCESLVDLPCLNHLTSLENLKLKGCRNLKKFPELPNVYRALNLSNNKIEEVPDSIEHLFVETLGLKNCPIVNFPRIPRCKFTITSLKFIG